MAKSKEELMKMEVFNRGFIVMTKCKECHNEAICGTRTGMCIRCLDWKYGDLG